MVLSNCLSSLVFLLVFGLHLSTFINLFPSESAHMFLNIFAIIMSINHINMFSIIRFTTQE